LPPPRSSGPLLAPWLAARQAICGATMSGPRAVWPNLRWALAAVLCIALSSLTDAAVSTADPAQTTELLGALEAAITEEDARKILDPHMQELKKLASQVVEKVVLRQWWGLAREIVAKSHTQQVDLSFAVRKAVRSLKDEADELLRTLNPKYGMAQQVAPAFQWAQNDTCIFLTVKFTVRWNAPGALEVTEPSVNMTSSSFNFTGLGKHSNNKYKYVLGLSLFDNIVPTTSSWNTASVGKLSVTLKKRWARKWPRLLGNKKTKIGNMHVWMEMQEKLDSSLGGMATVSNSPITCAAADKLYCLPTDTCKKPANCSQCPGKTTAKEEEHICTGMPSDKATLSFKDTDMDEHELGGTITITKARNEFDIDTYAIFWGKDTKQKLEGNPIAGEGAKLVGTMSPTGSDVDFHLKHNTAIPDGATHLLVFSENSFGEYATPGFTDITDAYLPRDKPKGMEFYDEDGEKGEVSGFVTIERAADESKLTDYALHWGRSATRKTSASSIKDIAKGGSDPLTYYISRSTKVPDGATHLLLFSKNEHGEQHHGTSLKLADNTKPCLKAKSADCPAGVLVKAADDKQQVATVVRAQDESSITAYSVFWGREGCEGDEIIDHSKAKNGFIKEVAIGDPMDVPLPAEVPDGTTHVLVFPKNKIGDSDICVSESFAKDVKPEL